MVNANLLYGPPAQASTALSSAGSEVSRGAQALYGDGGTKPTAPATLAKPAVESPKADAPAADGKPAAAPDAKAEAPQADAGTLYEPAVPGLEGVRWSEPSATSATDLVGAMATPEIEGVTYDDADMQGATVAFLGMGVGVTGAGAAMSIAREHAAEAAAGRVVTEAESVAQLEGWFGGEAGADRAIADARATVREAERMWPGLRDYLNRTGLGNNPKMIAALARHHRTRAGR